MVNTLKLKAAIVEAGYTQTALAQKLHISENSLSAKINGRAKFDIEEATEICEVLNIHNNEQKALIFLNL